MIRLASLSLMVVIYGQLFFNALRYYLNIPHPSWIFWIIIYSVTLLLALINSYKINLKVNKYDIYFLAFISYLIINFMVLGESDFHSFIFRIVTICLGPYLIGRTLGLYVGLSIFKDLKVITILYLLMIMTEIIVNPSLFFGIDRLRLFPFGGEQPDEGIGTAYLIGMTLGSMWVAAFVYLTMPIKKFDRKYNIIFLKVGVFVLPLVVLSVGSRSSIATMFACVILLSIFVALIFRQEQKTVIIKSLSILFFIIIGALIFIYFLPDSRKELLSELYGSLVSQGDNVGSCLSEGSSISVRIMLLSESIRMFLDNPIFGVGASNYGLYYCSTQAEFASPHSTFMQVLSELGVIGFCLFMLLLIEITRKFHHYAKSQRHSNHMTIWILFSLWMFMLIQAQISGNIYIDYHFYLLTGLFVSNLRNLSLPEVVSNERLPR